MWQWHTLRKTNPKKAVDDVDRRDLEAERAIDHRLRLGSRLRVPEGRDWRRSSGRFRWRARA